MLKISETHPSKIFKFCPKCGNYGFNFDGIKKFQCRECNFEFFINESTAVCGILELPDNRILLTRRKFNPKAGMLDLPGGFVDLMERAEEALIREIKEELNIDVCDLQFIATFPNEYNYKGISYFTCDLAFVIKLKEYPLFKPADDVSDIELLNPSEIDFSEIGFVSIRNILNYYITKFKK